MNLESELEYLLDDQKEELEIMTSLLKDPKSKLIDGFDNRIKDNIKNVINSLDRVLKLLSSDL